MGEKVARCQKSLSTLTIRFLEMLQKEPILDLNAATAALEFSKKRRIYDITNVMEGCALIKKVGKNMYKWQGKTCHGRTCDALNDDDDRLQSAKEDQKQLMDEEKELTDAVKAMKTSLGLIVDGVGKSFCYVTQSDFVDAFGEEQTVLVAKDFRFMKFHFDTDLDEDVLPQKFFNNSGDTCFRDIQISGSVVRPVQLKIVNSQFDASRLLCLDRLRNEDDHIKEEPMTSTRKASRKPKVYSTKPLYINLFRRRLKARKFLELEPEEREKLAEVALKNYRFEGKSLFNYVNSKQLVRQIDYSEPGFVDVAPLNDYEENYSSTAPSVYDLFDIPFEPLPSAEDFEMLEYLDDDEDSSH